MKAAISTLFLLLGIGLMAQNLKPKGYLGLEYTEASDSLMRSLRGLETRGILVTDVVEGHTASKLGLRPNDVIVAVNNVDSLYLYDFTELTKNLKEGEAISVTYVRDRRKARVVGMVSARPKETSQVGDVIYAEVPYGRGQLRSIIHKPTGSGRFPAVFYLQDYDCGSIDQSGKSNSATRKLIDGWVKAGYLVYRIEKPGVGESDGTKSCMGLSYTEELRAFENGFRALKKNPNADSTKIYLFGYAVGGITAPMLASKATGAKPKGIITYGTVVKSWFEHLIDTYREQPLLLKESQQSIDANTRMMTPLLFEWLVNKKPARELLENPDFEAIMTSNENPVQYNNGAFFGRAPQYFSDLNQQNIAFAWAQAGLPTLALHGEMDLQAISPKSAQTIAEIVNEAKPNRGTFKILKNTDHYFSKVASFTEYQKLQKTGKYRDHAVSNFNPEIIDLTVEWMQNNP